MGDVTDTALLVRAVFLLTSVSKLNTHSTPTSSRCLQPKDRLGRYSRDNAAFVFVYPQPRFLLPREHPRACSSPASQILVGF